jgi:hypothetical protein
MDVLHPPSSGTQAVGSDGDRSARGQDAEGDLALTADFGWHE